MSTRIDKNKITIYESKMNSNIHESMDYLKNKLAVEQNFDVVYRVLHIGGREACIYFVDGFCNDDIMQKLLQYFLDIEEKDMPPTSYELTKSCMPYVEVDMQNDWNKIIYFILSGVFALFIDGYDRCILIDSRQYPARSVSESEKDKVLRGSRDGFVETAVFNCALVRRRIRTPELRMEIMQAGKSSQTDIIVCYMDNRVDKDLLNNIKTKIKNIKVDALTMNQESLAECLYKRNWWNPFPKFKYTERPDVASAQILEGNIVILVDNSPSAMLIPTTIFDVVEEADDYYFPPITGTYLIFSRIIIALFAYFLTPTFLLMMSNPVQYLPDWLSFVMVKETINIPLVFQFLILELAIDGLRLAAVSTPNMLSTPLSVMAALVLGEFSVNSGWFNSEVMLYMAFVAIASYTQSNYELSYALKFMRILTLILTSIFGIYGYIAGVAITLLSLILNKTISGRSYLYPLLPLNVHELSKRLFRRRLPLSKEP